MSPLDAVGGFAGSAVAAAAAVVLAIAAPLAAVQLLRWGVTNVLRHFKNNAGLGGLDV